MSYKHNDLGFCCLSAENHKKLFGYEPYELANLTNIEKSKLKEPESFPSIELPELPELPYGKDVEEYFKLLAQKYFDEHDLDNKINQLLTLEYSDILKLKDNIDLLIDHTRANVWTKLDLNLDIEEMLVPDSDALIFDTETFVKGSDCNSPIVGQALGRDKYGVPSLYMWLHPSFDKNDDTYVPQKVSIGENKLLIAHNAAFDRQKVKDFYSLDISNNIVFCTMAMMKLVGGLTERQTWATKADPKTNHRAYRIQQYGCAMALVDSYKFITGKELPKDAKKLRDIFKKAEEFSEFRETRKDILTYSMLDVIYNWELFQKLYPRYMKMANHKSILAGQSIVIDSIVPHIDYWDQWVERCDLEYEKIEKKILDIIYPYIEKIHSEWLVTGNYSYQLEMMDWSYVLPYRHRKTNPLPENWYLRAKWFENFRNKEVKLKGRDLQLLLQCQYFYKDQWHDVIYTRKDAYHIIYENKVVKLPNRKKPGENYGSILSADSLHITNKEQPLLRSKLLSDKEFLKVLKLFDLTTTYTGFRNRVIKQNKEEGLVAAEVNPCGTISGRTSSSLYNTLPAHWDVPKIMSEIKMTSQCPEGWVFVGGDADSQEGSVASAMSDHYYSVSGATPFSRSVLIGNKKDQTDFHSLTAKAMTGKTEITSEERYGGKTANFGLVYGAGVVTTAKTIKFEFDDSDAEAFKKARKAVSGFKGERDVFDTRYDLEEKPFSPYTGGIASDVFNMMSDIIRQSPYPTGLFFKNQWPKSLQPRYCGDDGSPPQLNYCIQASCSTYGFLSAWVLSIMDEIKRNNISARFSISIHDEVWFLCREEYAERLAFIIMICYARVWALLHHNLYIEDLPVKRAFPSSISIDKILRKSCTSSTKTPSFDESEPGREVTIFDLHDYVFT